MQLIFQVLRDDFAQEDLLGEIFRSYGDAVL